MPRRDPRRRREPPRPRPRARLRGGLPIASLARASTLTLAAFAAAAVLDYAFAAAMSWLLPPQEYGVLSVSMTYFLLLSFFVASGFPMSLAKFLSEEPTPPRGLVRFAMLGNVVAAATVVALFLGLTFYGPLSPGPGYGRLVLAVAASVLLLAVGSTLQFALQGRMRFQAFALLHASKSANKLLAGAALVALGLGATGAVGGLVLGGAFLVVASLLALRKAGEDPRAGADLTREQKRRFLRYTAAVFAGSFALTLLMSVDLLAVKYLTPRAESDVVAAGYQAATLLTKAPLWAVLAALSVLFPLLSRAARRDPREAARLLRRALRWTLLLLAPASLVLLAFPDLALGVAFPAHYASAAGTLAASAPGMAALALCLVLTRALQATGHARAPGAYLAVSVALQAALLAVLVPRHGSVGAAWATTVACAFGAALAFRACAGPFRLRVRARDATALAASLALLVAVVWALRPEDGSRVGALLALAAGGAAYVAAVALLGLVTRGELRAVLRRLPLADRFAPPAAPEADA
ncbi:MAG TPA: polysaccharide biosynthesis C-terminal domain-containing protein [Candidatus Thermoplasmatota archaeon]|nr:polysaccharide biosynthesis C-terminal domain-containing protein [Candidatus Thermoplasmatota archaeon]